VFWAQAHLPRPRELTAFMDTETAGTAMAGSFLKEISVIVSIASQAMTLLRSQHRGLGPGRSWIHDTYLERLGENATFLAASWDGHVFLESSQLLSKLAPLNQYV